MSNSVFFIELRDAGKALAGKPADEIRASVEVVKARIKANEKIAKYVGGSFASQLEKAVVEAGGKQFLKASQRREEKHQHAHDHGRPVQAAGKRRF